jgi:hypothetical protein
MVQYLPGNEKRFIQRAVGIEMTIVNSQVLLEKKIHRSFTRESVRRRQ